MVTWQEASYVCEPILTRLKLANFDVERAMPNIKRYLSESHTTNSRARECIVVYTRMLAADDRAFDEYAHGQDSIHDKSILETRRKKELLMRVRSLLPRQ
jgi:hypothetical protein